MFQLGPGTTGQKPRARESKLKIGCQFGSAAVSPSRMSALLLLLPMPTAAVFLLLHAALAKRERGLLLRVDRRPPVYSLLALYLDISFS